MRNFYYIFFFLILFIVSGGFAQNGVKIYTTQFVPETITYNGSPNPNECWESVATGILIKDGASVFFFSIPEKEIEKLKQKIRKGEIIVECIFYEEPYENSGEAGVVLKITFNGEVIYTNN